MALSAFKSTTRRRGIQGNANDQDAAGHARTPDNLTAHHHKLKYGHKRSNSFTDVPPYSRYSGDASPRFRGPRSLRFLDRQLSEGDLAKSKPVGDIDCSQSAGKSGDEVTHRLGSPQVMQADSAMRPKLHRTISGHDKNFREHPEAQVEEKIIRAVHAQNKPKDSVVLSNNQNDQLYDIIKAEVFDMKEAIETTQEIALSGSYASESADMTNISLSEEIVKMFRYVCKAYVAKIDKAEEKVKHLRKQLAEKERICLDLTNLINELIPDGALQAHEVTPVKQGINKQVLKHAAGEAIGPFARSRSVLDDVACLKRLSGEEILLELEKEFERRRLHCIQSSSSSADCMSALGKNKDGLVLPWLTCEEANNLLCHSSKETESQAEHVTMRHSLPEDNRIKQQQPKIESYTLEGNTSPPLEWKNTCRMNDNIHPTCVAESSLLYIQSTELISQRIKFKARVEAGELLLCIGTLYIH